MPQSRRGIYYTGNSLDGVYAGEFGGYTSPFYLDYYADEVARSHGEPLEALLDRNAEWWFHGTVTTRDGRVVTNKESSDG